MSASKGDSSSGDGNNYFSTLQAPFPKLIGGKISTSEFLQASQNVVELVDRFGHIFAPVKYDMSGNIKKLTERYETDKVKNTFLEDMILIEQSEKGNRATDALLWLRRALHFLQTFFSYVLEDTKAVNPRTDLVPFIKSSYEKCLKMYHGWMAQQVFALISRMCPGRSELINILSLGNDGQEARIIADMEIFLQQLDVNIKTLSIFYSTYNLETNDKV